MNNPAGKYHFGNSHKTNVSQNKHRINPRKPFRIPLLKNLSEELNSFDSIGQMSQVFGFQIAKFEISETQSFEEDIGSAPEAWQYLSNSTSWKEYEKDIFPIVEFMNSIPGIVTTDCCSGHQDKNGVCYIGYISKTKEQGYKLAKALIEQVGEEYFYELSFRPGISDFVPYEKDPSLAVAKGRLGFYIEFKPTSIKDVLKRFDPQKLREAIL